MEETHILQNNFLEVSYLVTKKKLTVLNCWNAVFYMEIIQI